MISRRGRSDGVRIAIAGRYLDEVQIQQTYRSAPNSVSYLSFPARCHQAQVGEDYVIVSTPAATAVKLFADGLLPPVGERLLTMRID